MKTEKITDRISAFFALAGVALLLAAAFVVAFTHPTVSSGSTIFQGPVLQQATTTASFAVTSSTRVLATSTVPGGGASYSRIYATICNPNANPVYIALNGDKPASSTSATTVIAAAAGYNVCYVINDSNPYNGSVTASSTGQTSTTIFVSDYVY